ncbi:MAG: hypothetical protein RSC31_03350, partial [Anaerovoracaceae bacterium]
LAWPLRNPIGQNAEVGTSFATPTSPFANANLSIWRSQLLLSPTPASVFRASHINLQGQRQPRPLAMAN